MNIRDIQIRDPFVLAEGASGGLFLYGSTDKDIWKAPGVGFDVYRSSGSLEEWEGPFPAFRPPPGFWSERNFWAPEVYFVNGACFMFATFKPRPGTPWTHRGTAVLRADSPLGPFAPWSKGPVTPPDWECLDGTLYVDSGNGEQAVGKIKRAGGILFEKENAPSHTQVYAENSGGDRQITVSSPSSEKSSALHSPLPHLIFCHEWQQTGDGEVCAMPLSASLREAAGEPRLLFRASEAPWAAPLAGRPPVAGKAPRVTDGPFLWRTSGGALLLLWSSFDKAGRYCLGLARSESGALDGPWLQEETPLFTGDGGHGMLFTVGRAPASRLYLALHSPNKTPLERALFIPLVERGGTLRLAAG